MTDLNSGDFRQMYGIEFPSVSSMALLHAEPVFLAPNTGYTFSEKAIRLIDELIAPSNRTTAQFNWALASSKQQLHEEILVFFDRSYFMAQHIITVRSSIEEIAMVSCVVAGVDRVEACPPVGLLTIADVQTLTELALRSAFLGQILPIVDGPPDDAIWVYFLGKAECQEIELSADKEEPRAEENADLVLVSSK